MNKLFYILVFSLLVSTISTAGSLSSLQQTFQQKDTLVVDIKKEDELIEEVVKSRTIPKKEEVRYFNQVTKYGFKNLFSNYTYNATEPYTAQINPNAEFFIQDYMRLHGNHLQKMKGWGLPYFNLIENILIQYGLPKELKYIAVIESNLSTGATSQVGAGGPWQFMPYTAKDYGLKVNGYIDERRDYFKSTNAAARYLLYLYSQMHDWLLVMAAYNGGAGRVNEAIRRSGSRDFWKLQYYLPEESRTYVKRFIATHYIMEGNGGITTSGNDSLLFIDNITNRTNYIGAKTGTQKSGLTAEEIAGSEMLIISGKYNSSIIAKNVAMTTINFNRYNPGFDKMMSSNGTYDLRLPHEKMQLFKVNKYQILNESVQQLFGGMAIPESKTVYPISAPAKKRKK
ncbi:MAG: lytic transglycosylase domain-containing protein [Sphingobacteriales bacterium]|nr:lytic transglycosylase domain-containing protein [Sphingobacteriales bacterium]